MTRTAAWAGRAGIAAVLAGGCLWAAPTPAQAHGAQGLAYQGVSGPYLISAFDGRLRGGTDEAEYRIVLTRDPGDGQLGRVAPATPVYDATVAVASDHGAPTTAVGTGDVYSFRLPNTTQRLTIDIVGAPGRTRVAFRVHGAPAAARVAAGLPEGTGSRGNLAAPLLALALAGASLLSGVVVARRRRRPGDTSAA